MSRALEVVRPGRGLQSQRHLESFSCLLLRLRAWLRGASHIVAYTGFVRTGSPGLRLSARAYFPFFFSHSIKVFILSCLETSWLLARLFSSKTCKFLKFNARRWTDLACC